MQRGGSGKWSILRRVTLDHAVLSGRWHCSCFDYGGFANGSLLCVFENSFTEVGFGDVIIAKSIVRKRNQSMLIFLVYTVAPHAMIQKAAFAVHEKNNE
jgi:hypothetical protein